MMFKSHQVEMRTVVNTVLLNYSHSQIGMILTLNAVRDLHDDHNSS
jgi:hypothetical protein